jgi:hypothetical protein
MTGFSLPEDRRVEAKKAGGLAFALPHTPWNGSA